MQGFFVKTSLLVCLLAAASPWAVEKANETRFNEVAKRGAKVMPFDLEQTTHVFTKTEKGGLQLVIAKDPCPRRADRVDPPASVEDCARVHTRRFFRP